MSSKNCGRPDSSTSSAMNNAFPLQLCGYKAMSSALLASRLLATSMLASRMSLMTNPVEGIRKNYGTTVSLGIPRGTLVVHSKYGKCYVGGSSKGRLSLHNISDVKGKRLCQNAKKEDCILLAKQIWCGGFSSPYLKEGVSIFR